MYSKVFGIQAYLNFPTLFPITSVHTTSSSGRGGHLLFLIRALGHLMPGLFSYCPFCLLLNSQLRLFSIRHPRLNPNTNAFGKTFLTFPHGSNLFFCTIKLSQHLFENTCVPPNIIVKCMFMTFCGTLKMAAVSWHSSCWGAGKVCIPSLWNQVGSGTTWATEYVGSDPQSCARFWIWSLGAW